MSGCDCDAIDGDHDRPGCAIYVQAAPSHLDSGAYATCDLKQMPRVSDKRWCHAHSAFEGDCSPALDVLATMVEQVQHVVRQIDNALLDTRLNDMGRLYLRKVRDTLLFTEDVGDLWPEGQWEAVGPLARGDVGAPS